MLSWRSLNGVALAACLAPTFAVAGPPYVSDDPVPTAYHHYEIYLFAHGTQTRDDANGAGGIDFNSGFGPNLQLTAVLPLGLDVPSGGTASAGLSNIELAAKYRFLHQEDVGWDVAVFPRLFLPASTASAGPRHSSFLLPLWFGRNVGKWGTFGGGGCVLNRGGDSQDFCLGGWALTRQINEHVQLGGELTHQTSATRGGKPSTALGAGLIYDLSEHQHFLAYFAPGLENAAETGRYNWYTSLLFTF